MLGEKGPTPEMDERSGSGSSSFIISPAGACGDRLLTAQGSVGD